MRRHWARRWFRAGCYLLTVGMIGLIGLAGHFRVWSLNDYRAYQWAQEYGQLGYDLWFSELHAGQDVDELLRRATPWHRQQYGRFEKLSFLKAAPVQNEIPCEMITVVCRDGRLVWAGLGCCVQTYTFFDSMTREDEEEADQAIASYCRERGRIRWELTLDRLQLLGGGPSRTVRYFGVRCENAE